VTLHVRDVPAAAWFYREALGVELEPAVPREERGGIPRVALVASGETTANAELAFEVDDLDAAHARAVAAGAEVLAEPQADERGRRAAYRDPDGNVVTLRQAPPAPRAAGVDLARGGWAVVVLEENRVVDAFRCETFAEALLVDAPVVAVDIPIGVPESGSRPADVAARRFVGARGSSVFPTPIRPVLEAPTYAEARALAKKLTGKSISAQAYALRLRILEVDELAREDGRVIEVHPEVSFRELSHRPLLSKHRSDGLAERGRDRASRGRSPHRRAGPARRDDRRLERRPLRPRRGGAATRGPH
jgi:predicted enzyme related to lactoylglutathione lyase/predicted nuclease with RNAse H fold